MVHKYFNQVKDILDKVETNEGLKIGEAAEKISATLQQDDGVVHLFGCGHSHMLTEEVYYRAGGLVPVHPILHEPLMLHEGAIKSSELERQPDYARTFMEEQDIRENDVMIVISTSGRNPVPLDTALIAKEKGAFVIGLSSFIYAEGQTSRHTSGKFLHEVVDLGIDTHIPVGDALLSDTSVAVNFAPGSTVVGASILNEMMGKVISSMAENGFDPPVLLSGNVDGADMHNKKIMEKYKKRISF
ncbi:SIS domain-containing protein [Oceanobacillus senegalensis]|uniref:SIS domain-containing protein n=1 Tax=Oceanobacillus senegalensis TaxID=1936063 RepID=UPI000A306396|nr:SIS domain-containing protein [Oceanobacillus senegalensis]